MRREIIAFYIQQIQAKNPAFSLPKEFVDKLVKETNGLSIRAIKGLSYNIYRTKIQIGALSQAIKTCKNNNVDTASKGCWKEDAGLWTNLFNTTLNAADFAIRVFIFREPPKAA